MLNETIEAIVLLFEADLAALKSASLIKYNRVKEKTFSYTNEIISYKFTYSDGGTVYNKFFVNMEYCNDILSYFTELSDSYLEKWK